MPFANINGFRMHYRVDGSREAPPLLLSNSLGTNLDMWLPQLESWRQSRCVIRYDGRGHVQSETAMPPYTIATLAQDSLALLDFLQIDKADFCGLSLGGMIGQWIAIHRASRLNKLILANTSAAIGSPEIWNNRIDAVLRNGMDTVAKQVRLRWFTPGFCKSHERVVAETEKMLQSLDPQGYVYCCEAIRDADLRCGLKDISAKALILWGEQDPVIPPQDREAFVAAIPGCEHLGLPAAHLSNVEEPQRFTNAVLEFLG